MKKKKKYNVAVIGVGAVGIEMIRCLIKRNFPIDNLSVFARSSRTINIDNKDYQVNTISENSFNGIDIALFAGTEGEKGAAVMYAKKAVSAGAVVIDNGADFRLEPTVPLVVPEVNPQDIKKHKGIIANPNCSTIQLVVAIWPIYKRFGIKRIIVTTFQAASGAGRAAVEQLNEEISKVVSSGFNNIHVDTTNKVLPQQLAYNLFPHIGGFSDFDYTTEEWKLVKETHKIMHDNKIKISATCVRVPVRTGHSEAVYLETKERPDIDAIRKILSKAKGIVLIDEPQKSLYPMPKDVEGKDEVFVGRIRKDPYVKNGLWLWVVADNLLKGAALNAVQIAEYLIR